jgi:hypothetical protein
MSNYEIRLVITGRNKTKQEAEDIAHKAASKLRSDGFWLGDGNMNPNVESVTVKEDDDA